MKAPFFSPSIIGRLALAVAGAAVFAAGAQTRIDPLPPDEVFVFSASAEGQTAKAGFSLPPDFYMYKERFAFSTPTPGIQILGATFPPAETYDDPFFGKTEIYYHGATVAVDIAGQGEFELHVVSQGCDKLLGICYPPQTHKAILIAGADGGGGQSSFNGDYSAANENGEVSFSEVSFKDNAVFNEGDDFSADEAAAAAATLASKNLPMTMLIFFGFGLLLSFTPCVLPMLPVLLGVLGGGRGRKAKTLTAAYIGGVAAVYTSLGIAAGLSGQLLAPFLQQPPMLIGSALVFVALSLSMFGMYDIRMPGFLRGLGAGGSSLGGAAGAFAMGGLSAAVLSPCVAAPLIGALIYIGNTGDALSGGLALLSLSLGMSALLAVAGIFGGAALPKAGAWMGAIKQLSGAGLLAAAVWLVSPLLPAAMSMFFYGALLVFCGALPFSRMLSKFKSDESSSSENRNGAGAESLGRAMKAVGAAALLWGGAMIVGAAGGGRDPLSPLSPFTAEGRTTTAAALPEFAAVESLPQLRTALAESGRPAMLEFYADWCVSCKEMEKFTFADSEVRGRLQNLALLRADITDNTEAHRAMLKEFGLYGPPAILFFTPDGRWISNARVSGYQPPARFIKTLSAAGV